MCPTLYYELLNAALNNRHPFHVVAWADKKSTTRGVCSWKQTSKYKKWYKGWQGSCHERHAEVDLLLKLGKKAPRKIYVTRFKSNGDMTMARPCIHCQNFMRQRGVEVVKYTNWDGAWEELQLG